MNLEVSQSNLLALVAKQLDNLFCFDAATEKKLLKSGLQTALQRCQICFQNTPNKYYRRGDETYFSPWHSGQYSIFLYYLSNSIAKESPANVSLADRLYYLNKALNGLDLFHQVEMPSVFFLDHPVGSVLGRASYGDGFAFSQNCTVGNNRGVYPVIGKNVQLMSGAKVIGNCHIGDNVIVSANSYIKNTDIPSSSIVFGSDRDLHIKPMDTYSFGNRLDGE